MNFKSNMSENFINECQLVVLINIYVRVRLDLDFWTMKETKIYFFFDN